MKAIVANNCQYDETNLCIYINICICVYVFNVKKAFINLCVKGQKINKSDVKQVGNMHIAVV